MPDIKTIAIDFDDTLFEVDYPRIIRPIWGVINAAKAEKKRGNELILWTTREGAALAEALKACDGVGLKFDAINDNTPRMKALWGNNPRKVGADEYWDDRSKNPYFSGSRFLKKATVPCDAIETFTLEYQLGGL